MENRITVREALPGAETERFRARLLEYRRRDVFTLPDDAAHLEREGEYFAHMLRLRRMLTEDGFTVRQVRPTWIHRMRARLRGEDELYRIPADGDR